MSALSPAVLSEEAQRAQHSLDWSDIEWREAEPPNAAVADAQTQTEPAQTSEAEAQTSHAVATHMDLERTPSRLRPGALVEPEGLGGALFQFDRQALGRISTSPTLRRMRSSRRSQTELRDPVRMERTQEEPGAAQRGPQPPAGPASPGLRHILSPLAPSPLCEGAGSWTSSSTGRQRTRSRRSKTIEDRTSGSSDVSPGETSGSRDVSPGQQPTDFEFPCSEGQVRLMTGGCGETWSGVVTCRMCII